MDKRMRFRALAKLLAAATLAATLAACGGGGGGSGEGTQIGGGKPPPPVARQPEGDDGANELSVACTGCGASDGGVYAGSGTGLWQNANKLTYPRDVPVAISGLNGERVTLVFTNESHFDVAMPALAVSMSRSAPNRSLSGAFAKTSLSAAQEEAKTAISEFNRAGFDALRQRIAASPGVNRSLIAPPRAVYMVGSQRSVYLVDHTQRTVELAAQRLTGDGTTVNVWVQVEELDPQRVTSTLVARMSDAFANTGGIYDMLLELGGPLWGVNGDSELLDGTVQQPVDLFFVNFDNNQQPYGLGGYFYSLNNFKAGAGAAESNESLALFMDTETMYLDGEDGLKQIVTTMAHEGTHMQNFYRRGVRMGVGNTYDLWLEEMTAMMVEDWVSHRLDPTHNAIRDVRFPAYLSYGNTGAYNCGLLTWKAMEGGCDSYAVAGSFGGYLNRQFGVQFLKNIFKTKAVDSSIILDTVIDIARPGSSIGKEMRHFSVAAAGLVPLAAGIAEYSMPERDEDGFHLVGIDPDAFGEAGRDLPSAVPPLLQGLASFPVTRGHPQGSFNETVRVPAGTTLTVVVN